MKKASDIKRRKQAQRSAIANFFSFEKELIEDKLGGIPEKSIGIICYRCAQVAPLQTRKGKRIYKCNKCKRVWNANDLAD